jgi:hypothetical protein
MRRIVASPRDGVKLAGERHRFARKTVMNIAVRRSFDKKIRFEGNFGEWLDHHPAAIRAPMSIISFEPERSSQKRIGKLRPRRRVSSGKPDESGTEMIYAARRY